MLSYLDVSFLAVRLALPLLVLVSALLLAGRAIPFVPAAVSLFLAVPLPLALLVLLLLLLVPADEWGHEHLFTFIHSLARSLSHSLMSEQFYSRQIYYSIPVSRQRVPQVLPGRCTHVVNFLSIHNLLVLSNY